MVKFAVQIQTIKFIMADNKVKLFTEFPPVSTQEWVDKITADLKGADFNRKLVWRTLEGFDVQPFYRQENLDDKEYLNQLPGEYPYLRGTKTDNDWFIRQDIKVEDMAEANKKALDCLNKGVNSLAFCFDVAETLSEEKLAALLKDIAVECIELNFDAPHASKEILAYLIKHVSDKESLNGSLNLDALGNFALTGAFCEGAEKSFDFAADLIKASKALPKFKTLAVNGRYLNNAGATSVQELAFTLAMGAEYLHELTERGLGIDEIAPKVKFNFGINGNYFMEIAKIRAARFLWSKVVEAYQPVSKEVAKMNIHAETTGWNKTVYDPYVNMLRSQTETMSGVLAGVDSFTVHPFNAIYEETNPFSERIARNQQILLKEESYFDKVVDVAGGSYYIENLTDAIIEHAWKLFLEVQEKGGFVAAMKEGFVQEKVNESVAVRQKNIATRKDTFLGTNQFPNTSEINKNIKAEQLQPISKKAENAIVEPLLTQRATLVFEDLRRKTDQSGRRPKVFMMTMGNLAFRLARAQFSANFFGVAGFEPINNNGFNTVEEGVNAALEAKADIVVLCSSDEEYAGFAPAAYELLNEKALFVVAGNPSCADELKAKGITNFIHVKSNVLTELSRYQSELGIN